MKKHYSATLRIPGTLLCGLLTWGSCLSCIASDQQTNVTVRGTSLSYTLTAPADWNIDTSNATNVSLYTSIWPSSSVWSNSGTQISVSVRPGERAEQKKIFENDEELITAEGKTIVMHFGRAGTLPMDFSPGGNTIPTAWAFANEGGDLIAFGLQSDDKHWRVALDIFKQFLMRFAVLHHSSEPQTKGMEH